MSRTRYAHAAALAMSAATLTAALADTATAPAATARPAMLDAWTGPYGGVPAWDKVKPDEFVRALEIAMDDQRAEIKAIAESKDKPTFDNTIVALDRIGATFDNVGPMYGVYSSNLNLGPMPAIQKQMAPKFAAFGTEIIQNKQLWERVAAVYEGPEFKTLDAQQQRMTTDRYRRFVRAGAKLN